MYYLLVLSYIVPGKVWDHVLDTISGRIWESMRKTSGEPLNMTLNKKYVEAGRTVASLSRLSGDN